MANEPACDTATRDHVLIPQGSTIHGSDQANQLVYGDERLETVAMTRVFPRGQSVD
jgi:type IV secretory pathway VirB10-like protein